MAYTIRNSTKEFYIFNIPHDDNIQRAFTLSPGQYKVTNQIGSEYFVTDAARDSLIQDIFNASGEGRLSVKDDSGNDVTYKQYKDANP